jgi:quercetin dioxygenase-like cupin family protein
MRRAFLGIALAAVSATAEGQTREGGVTWNTVLDNDTVTVTRVHMPPGTAGNTDVPNAPFVIAQITPGDVELTQMGQDSRGPRPGGAVTFLPPGVPHRVVNIGKTTFDMLFIKIKSTREPAPAASATEAPPGITRTPVVDNDFVRVVRVLFAPGGHEPLHTHPNDLLTMQVIDGKVEIVAGSDRSTAVRDAGFVQFLPRNVSHAYANADVKPFELLSGSIK